jgi:hypothetical protein
MGNFTYIFIRINDVLTAGVGATALALLLYLLFTTVRVV